MIQWSEKFWTNLWNNNSSLAFITLKIISGLMDEVGVAMLLELYIRMMQEDLGKGKPKPELLWMRRRYSNTEVDYEYRKIKIRMT